MNERFVLFGILFWSIDTADTAVIGAAQPVQPYGICIDITLCQRPPYNSLCAQGLPICQSATKVIPIVPTKVVSPSSVESASIKSMIVTTIVYPSPTVSVVTAASTVRIPLVSSTTVPPPRPLNFITIKNNVRIEFGKKSNVTHY